MSIADRVNDAEFLWKHGRVDGAFLLAMVAVAATSKRIYPIAQDRQAFESFLKQGIFERIHVEFLEQVHPVYHIFYKWVRCELIHEGGFPVDVEIVSTANPGTVSIRAGGAPHYKLQLSESWFYELIHAVKTAPINSDIFPQ